MAEETDEERAKEQEIVDAIYGAFVGRVAKARGMTERIGCRELATGEVWLGERAASNWGWSTRSATSSGPSRSRRRSPGSLRAGRPVRLRRSLFGRVAGRFATTLAAAVADEIEARSGNRLLT